MQRHEMHTHHSAPSDYPLTCTSHKSPRIIPQSTKKDLMNGLQYTLEQSESWRSIHIHPVERYNCLIETFFLRKELWYSEGEHRTVMEDNLSLSLSKGSWRKLQRGNLCREESERKNRGGRRDIKGKAHKVDVARLICSQQINSFDIQRGTVTVESEWIRVRMSGSCRIVKIVIVLTKERIVPSTGGCNATWG